MPVLNRFSTNDERRERGRRRRDDADAMCTSDQSTTKTRIVDRLRVPSARVASIHLASVAE
jgi:hypothetical protein